VEGAVGRTLTIQVAKALLRRATCAGSSVGSGVDPRCAGTAARALIPVPSGVRVWLAVGRTDMRRGMNGLALQDQKVLRHNPHVIAGNHPSL
jgi:hypothetical protein